MDPNACCERILAAIHAGDRAEEAEAWSDLRGWLGRGGFPPRPELVAQLEYELGERARRNQGRCAS